MHPETGQTLLALLLVFTAGKLGGEVAERLRQPAVIGELIAGMLIGPGLLKWVQPSTSIETVATLGVVVLMFVVGLETKPSELFRVGGRAMIVGTLGVVLPFIAGFAFGSLLGMGNVEALFIGTALVATSVGITARVLADRGLISTVEARIVLAAAVIDDVLGMLVLSLVVGSTRGGGLDWTHVAVLLAQVAVFIAFEAWLAPRLVRRHAHLLDRLRMPHAPLIVSLVVMLGTAALAETIGLAGIVGAFFAGMMFAETSDRWELERQTRPLYEWLVPYFFVLTGMQVDLTLFARPEVLGPAAVLSVIAVVTKVAGCGIGVAGRGLHCSLAVGVGMVPRGEVGLIVASVGLASGILTASTYAMVVGVVLVSTMLVPPLLPALFERAAAATSAALQAEEAAEEAAPA